MSAKTEWRDIDASAPVRLVASGEGYAMVRRKGCAPFIISLTVWEVAPRCTHTKEYLA